MYQCKNEEREKNLESTCKMFTTDCKKLSFIMGLKEKPFASNVHTG